MSVVFWVFELQTVMAQCHYNHLWVFLLLKVLRCYQFLVFVYFQDQTLRLLENEENN